MSFKAHEADLSVINDVIKNDKNNGLIKGFNLRILKIVLNFYYLNFKAAFFGQKALVEELIEKRNDVNKIDDFGCTALHYGLFVLILSIITN